MKTTLEIPDALFRRAKSVAAQRGIAFRQLVSEALAEKLKPNGTEERPWMRQFGGLRALRTESARIDRIIEREFDEIERRIDGDFGHQRALGDGRWRPPTGADPVTGE